MQKQTLLITGGLGYIGSHAVVAFEEAGYKTVIIDNCSNSSKKSLENIKKILGYSPDFHKVDTGDKIALDNVFRTYNFDGVIHFAGSKFVSESIAKPIEYYRNNVCNTLNLLDVMDNNNVRKIVFSSTA